MFDAVILFFFWGGGLVVGDVYIILVGVEFLWKDVF